MIERIIRHLQYRTGRIRARAENLPESILRILVDFTKFVQIPFLLRLWQRHLLADKGINFSGKRIIFFPYENLDSDLQHFFVAQLMRNAGATTEVVRGPAAFYQKIVSSVKNDDVDLVFQSFDTVIEKLIELAGNDKNYARGVIDEFVASCPLAVFDGKFFITRAFISKVIDARSTARIFAAESDGIIVTDSSYVINRGLISACNARGVPIYALNPWGQWARIVKGAEENSSTKFLDIVTQPEWRSESKTAQIDAYLNARFSGKSQKDLDSARAFSGSTMVRGASRKKKVLFLHSFRDASQNNFPSNTGLLFFPTYFQWADAAFGFVSKQQDDWIIKPHPSQHLYANDREIMELLIAKHGINPAIVRTDITTGSILNARWAVYTFSGTIAKEAAVFGYKAHTVGEHIPGEISVRANTYEEFARAYQLNPDDAVIPLTDPTLVNAARALLYNDFNASSAGKHLSPERPIQISASRAHYLSQRFRTWVDLSVKFCSKSAILSASKIADQVSNDIKSDA